MHHKAAAREAAAPYNDQPPWSHLLAPLFSHLFHGMSFELVCCYFLLLAPPSPHCSLDCPPMLPCFLSPGCLFLLVHFIPIALFYSYHPSPPNIRWPHLYSALAATVVLGLWSPLNYKHKTIRLCCCLGMISTPSYAHPFNPTLD